jgi:hypothetical protein
MRVGSKPFIEVYEDDERGALVDKDFGHARRRVERLLWVILRTRL